MYCINCGKENPDNAKFCLECGTPNPKVNPAPGAGNANTAQGYYQGGYTPPNQYGENLYGANPYGANPYGANPQAMNPNLLQMLSSKIQTNGIIWIIVGVIQILFSIYFLFLAETSYYYDDECMIFAISFLVVGIINIIIAIKDMNYSKEILARPCGIVQKFTPVGGAVGTLNL